MSLKQIADNMMADFKNEFDLKWRSKISLIPFDLNVHISQKENE